MKNRKLAKVHYQTLAVQAMVFGLVAGIACLAGLVSFLVVRAATVSLNTQAVLNAPIQANAPQAGPDLVNIGSQGQIQGDGQQPADLNAPEPGIPAVDQSGDLVLDDDGRDPAIPANLTPWDGAGRVTILLLGLDYRDWEEKKGHPRSDTMILLTLDPTTKKAGMLNIPRDMWVPIPGFKHGKINTAYYLGSAHKLPGGGPGLAVKTVEAFLGVPINYYAQIDFGAFVRFIDELGGVKVDVPEKITIDLLGSGKETKKNLKPGVQVLPGEWALAYARARYTKGGDFDRGRRQQQVILGIRDRIINARMLPALISKAPTLYKELSSGIDTNLSLTDAIRLALLAQSVKDEDIQQGVIGQGYTLFGQSPDDLSILIPIPDKIHVLRDQIFASTGVLGPETPGDGRAQMAAEAARVAIFNGSSTTGLAERTAEYLRSQGANVVQVGDASDRYTSTTIVDYRGRPYALKYMVELMKIQEYKIISKYNPNSPVDVEVFLGVDWARDNPLP